MIELRPLQHQKKQKLNELTQVIKATFPARTAAMVSTLTRFGSYMAEKSLLPMKVVFIAGKRHVKEDPRDATMPEFSLASLDLALESYLAARMVPTEEAARLVANDGD